MWGDSRGIKGRQRPFVSLLSFKHLETRLGSTISHSHMAREPPLPYTPHTTCMHARVHHDDTFPCTPVCNQRQAGLLVGAVPCRCSPGGPENHDLPAFPSCPEAIPQEKDCRTPGDPCFSAPGLQMGHTQQTTAERAVSRHPPLSLSPQSRLLWATCLGSLTPATCSQSSCLSLWCPGCSKDGEWKVRQGRRKSSSRGSS